MFFPVCFRDSSEIREPPPEAAHLEVEPNRRPSYDGPMPGPRRGGRLRPAHVSRLLVPGAVTRSAVPCMSRGTAAPPRAPRPTGPLSVSRWQRSAARSSPLPNWRSDYDHCSTPEPAPSGAPTAWPLRAEPASYLGISDDPEVGWADIQPGEREFCAQDAAPSASAWQARRPRPEWTDEPGRRARPRRRRSAAGCPGPGIRSRNRSRNRRRACDSPAIHRQAPGLRPCRGKPAAGRARLLKLTGGHPISTASLSRGPDEFRAASGLANWQTAHLAADAEPAPGPRPGPFRDRLGPPA